MQDDRPGRTDSSADPVRDGQVTAICQRHGNQPGELIEILHDVQTALGFVPDGVLPVIAQALNLSRAEVYGVRTFYHDFHAEPAGKHILQLCRAEACQAMGCERLAASLAKSLGIAFGETTEDGAITLRAVYCLGNCGLAPAAMLDGRLIGRADAQVIATALAAAKAGR